MHQLFRNTEEPNYDQIQSHWFQTHANETVVVP